MSERLTEQFIYSIVVSYTRKLEKDDIVPHKLKRVFAKLAQQGGSPIDRFQRSLGHDSIYTTEKHLGIEQNPADAPFDHPGLKINQGSETSDSKTW
jgi:site-specific recombinase XerD